ncbi:MAG TPA: T9SS type A sorting domain-containing protein [Ignavibacteria bacterium]|nr:T9SS type A sorting domain-containing protein [Ignavibacteria bacterium]
MTYDKPGSVYLNKYKIQNTVTDVRQFPDNIPSDFRLYQNYPNPFNPTTIIKYSVPRLSFVQIKVYNILGELVKELLNKEVSEGTYSINFNASGLASGIYFYRLSVMDNKNNFTQTEKMILLR